MVFKRLKEKRRQEETPEYLEEDEFEEVEEDLEEPPKRIQTIKTKEETQSQPNKITKEEVIDLAYSHIERALRLLELVR